MAAATSPSVSTGRPTVGVKIIDFVPEQLKAPFELRCAALSLDYILLLAFPAAWLAIGKVFGDPGSVGLGTMIWLIGIVVFLFNFLVMPLFRGQTIGKMLTGLTILKIDGSDIGFSTVLRRNVIGYLATLLTLGIGFLIAAVNPSGRALHDFFAGTVVIRGRKKTV